MDLTGETNATLNITDANSTMHDGNYSVVVNNDFGSVESDLVEVSVKDGILNGLVGWWKFDEGSELLLMIQVVMEMTVTFLVVQFGLLVRLAEH